MNRLLLSLLKGLWRFARNMWRAIPPWEFDEGVKHWWDVYAK